MRKIYTSLFLILVITTSLFSQSLVKEPYTISKDRLLYTIGYAHLDTEWNWDYPTTINRFLKNTMEDNFKLFDLYPDYVFNFTGSRRYHLMKEYYPESYQKVVDLIKQGRWYVSGSSVDEGDVNSVSAESIIRQVLYGNNYFRKEFGKESYDYMLPDCFGFQAHLPSVWNHAGLLGFSTQKLSWGSANGIPFNVGVWNGPDGKGIIGALNATSYGGRIVERLDQDSVWDARLTEDFNQYGISFDYRYYGVGDVGGAPREQDVKYAVGSLHHHDSKFRVLLSSSDQMYNDITPAIRKKLPTYYGDLLLTQHSAGSITSQSYMKRANRKNEFLAANAEALAVGADWLGLTQYPFEKLNNSWELVLGSQFHDILPGTSIPKAYEYAWNDEFIAANGFAEILKHQFGAITSVLDTRTKGRAVVVYNPVACEREDIVRVVMDYDRLPEALEVYGPDSKMVPSQILSADHHQVKLIFMTHTPSVGLTVYDIREGKSKTSHEKTDLKVDQRSVENRFYKVQVDNRGDLISIYDKLAGRELLAAPARLEFLSETPTQWPAWNMDWADRQQPPIAYMNEDAEIKILENGPVRVALEINRKGRNSEITQVLSLSAGEAGKRIEVTNLLDWQSKEVSLKAAFPLSVSNEMATYNLSAGTIERSTNTPVKYEVPSKEWIDLTDQSGNYGVSILDDCKVGSDKPDDKTLRLTLMYTPRANSYVYQSTQDWGIHDFRYGIFGHTGDWRKGGSQLQGRLFNQPLIAFEVEKHTGDFGKSLSLISINNTQTGLMAFKKLENGQGYLVRINELNGNPVQNVLVSFPGKVVKAWEVNGQEQKLADATIEDGKLLTQLSKYELKSFAIIFDQPRNSHPKGEQKPIQLTYNEDVISFDSKRSDGHLTMDGATLPAEQLPPVITSEDVTFVMGSFKDGSLNAVSCGGQNLAIPKGTHRRIYLLATALHDTKSMLKLGSSEVPFQVQAWTGFVGQHYVRHFFMNNLKVDAIDPPFSKRDNIAWFSTHHHSPESNEAYQFSYLYSYGFDLPDDAQTITLPDNSDIKILAVTLVNSNLDIGKPLQALYDDFSNHPKFRLRNENDYIRNDIPQEAVKVIPLFSEESVSRMRSSSRLKNYLLRIGADTVVTTEPPAKGDFADSFSGNGVSMKYYATGTDQNGTKYNHTLVDVGHMINTENPDLEHLIWFADGEGRYVIDLQKSVPIEKINLFYSEHRDRGMQMFSVWASDKSNDFLGNPYNNGWKYLGAINTTNRYGISGNTLKFERPTNYRYLMIISDGHWHGNDYFEQVDVFTR